MTEPDWQDLVVSCHSWEGGLIPGEAAVDRFKVVVRARLKADPLVTEVEMQLFDGTATSLARLFVEFGVFRHHAEEHVHVRRQAALPSEGAYEDLKHLVRRGERRHVLKLLDSFQDSGMRYFNDRIAVMKSAFRSVRHSGAVTDLFLGPSRGLGHRLRKKGGFHREAALLFGRSASGRCRG